MNDPHEIEAQFYRDFAEATNRTGVLDRYLREYPELSREFRSIAEMDGALLRSQERHEHPARLGEFRIVRHIATGGMGEVYEAIQESLDRRVALKTIRLGRGSPSAESRFMREQSVLGSLHQTHIVPIHAAGKDQNLQYFAMQYIEGNTLRNLLNSVKNSSDTDASKTPTLAELAVVTLPTIVEPPELATRRNKFSQAYYRSVAESMIEVADALQHAHDERILHRDIKPSNLMLDRTGHCWIIDFGLAGYLNEERTGHTQSNESTTITDATLTSTGIIGTPQYMAPEQCSGGQFDVRTDVWGMGATLHELLTLRQPFTGSNVGELMRAIRTEPLGSLRRWATNVPFELAAICRKALQKEPANRYATARGFADDLRRWLRVEPTSTRTGLFWVWWRFWLLIRRNKGWTVAITFLFAAIAVIIGLEIRAAQTRSRATGERERDRRREVIIQKVQLLRLNEHSYGWRECGLKYIDESVSIRAGEDMRDHAASLLIGIDAVLEDEFTKFDASSIALTPDGTRLLCGGTKAGAKLWDKPTSKMHTASRPGPGPVAFRPDGTSIQLIVDPADRAQLLLWNVAKDELIRSIAIDKSSDTPNLALTDDGAFFVASTKDNTRIIIGRVDGQVVPKQIEIEGSKVSALTVSPDGSQLACGLEDGRILYWKSLTGVTEIFATAERRAVFSLAFGRQSLWPAGSTTPHSRHWLLAAGFDGGAIQIWDVQRRIPKTYCRGSSYGVFALKFGPDATILASGGRSDTRLWDVATGQVRLVMAYNDFISGLAFSADGRKLAVSTIDGFGKGCAMIWKLEYGRGIDTYRGLVNQISKVVLSPDGNSVAALSHDWFVGIWDRKSGHLRHLLEVPAGFTADHAALAFSPDGQQFAFSAGTSCKLFNLTAGTSRTWALPFGMSDVLMFDPDGQKLRYFRLELVDRNLPTMIGVPGKGNPRIGRIRELLANPKDDLRRANDDTSMTELPGMSWTVKWSEMSSDGKHVIVCAKDGADDNTQHFRCYNIQDGRELWTYQSPGSTGSIDPTGAIVYVSHSEKQYHLLDVPTGKLNRTFSHGLHWLGPEGRSGANFDTQMHGLVYKDHDGNTRVRLGIDNIPSIVLATFSRNGDLMAWGNRDGSVHVAELPVVQAHLISFGLGW